MRFVLAALIVTVSVSVQTVMAQEDGESTDIVAPRNVSRNNVPVFEAPSMSSELWLYLQEQKKAEDPMYNVRRKAAMKAEQRELRLAASKWYGYSNTRPTASGIPFMGTYSPSWIGNGSLGSHWVGSTLAPVATIVVTQNHGNR